MLVNYLRKLFIIQLPHGLSKKKTDESLSHLIQKDGC